MRSASFLASAGVLALWTGAATHAQVTQATIQIGGNDSCSSSGFNDPGRLNDGVTEGRAQYTFTLDGSTNTLTLVVENTSPDVPGVCNPIITNIWFTTHPVLDRVLTLQSQVGSGGIAPDFQFVWDPNLQLAPNPNHIEGFGQGFGFANGHLFSSQGLQNGIKNSNATTFVSPPNTLVCGPVTFTFDINGPLIGGNFDASAFTSFFTVAEYPEKSVHAAAGYWGGGASCHADGNIGDGVEDCYITTSASSGTTPWMSPAPTFYNFQTQIGPMQDYYTVTMEGPLHVLLPRKKLSKLGAPKFKLDQFALELYMYNPQVFPTNPEQHSLGLDVTIWSDGTYNVATYGTVDGIDITWEEVRSWRGTRFLKFPFTIQGFPPP